MHHHMMATEDSRPITELAAKWGAELHRSELQHLKVNLETWNRDQMSQTNLDVTLHRTLSNICSGPLRFDPNWGFEANLYFAKVQYGSFQDKPAGLQN